MPGPTSRSPSRRIDEVGAAREHGVEMRADDDRRQVADADRAADDVADGVGVDVAQPAVAEAARDPLAALLLFAGRRRDLRDRDLRAHDRVIVRGQARVRGGERAMRGAVSAGRPARALSCLSIATASATTQVVDSSS